MSKTKLHTIAVPIGTYSTASGPIAHELVGAINGVGALTGTLTVDSPQGQHHDLEGSIAGAGTLFCLGRQLQVAHSLFHLAPGIAGAGTCSATLSVSSLFQDYSVALVSEQTGFWIAEADASGNIVMSTATRLNPGPTVVRYPERFNVETKSSKDGTHIAKKLLKDGRIRSWVWKRYKSTIPKYDTLYNRLLNYQYKLRQKSSPAKSQYVFLRETESGNFTKRVWTGNQWIETEPWVRVKVIQVNRSPSEQSGPAVYDETELVFIVDDANWNNY